MHWVHQFYALAPATGIALLFAPNALAASSNEQRPLRFNLKGRRALTGIGGSANVVA